VSSDTRKEKNHQVLRPAEEYQTRGRRRTIRFFDLLRNIRHEEGEEPSGSSTC